MPDIILVTHRGKMIGVNLYKYNSEGTNIAKSVLESLKAICDMADEEQRKSYRGILLPLSRVGNHPILDDTFELSWNDIGVSFEGEDHG
jgi:hypothetical protein